MAYKLEFCCGLVQRFKRYNYTNAVKCDADVHMKQVKFFLISFFDLNARQKAFMVSVLLHLGIFFTLFTTPMIKTVSYPQIITVNFLDRSGLSTGRVESPVAKPAQLKRIFIKDKGPNLNMQARDTNNKRNVPLKETSLVSISEKVLLENQPPAQEGSSISTAAITGVSAVDKASSGSFQNDHASENGLKGGSSTGNAEAHFGDYGAPTFLYQEMPVYPALARRLGKEGRVLLKLVIGTDGKLVNVEVVEGAGYGFTEASVAAVKKSTYAPGYRNGNKVSTWVLLPVSFRLQ